MSICNRMTLAQFGRLATEEEDALPVHNVAWLLKDIAAKEKRIKAVKAQLDAVLARRYGCAAWHLRGLAHETRESVTLVDGDFIVTAEIRQEVMWDQKKLAKLAEIIFHDWQHDPEDYINISYTVDEPTYLAWPPELRKHFDDARSLSTATPSFAIAAVKRRPV